MVEKEAGRGPLGLTEGRGGIVELALLLGADLEWVLASTGEPGMAGLFFSLLSAKRKEGRWGEGIRNHQVYMSEPKLNNCNLHIHKNLKKKKKKKHHFNFTPH